MTKANINPRLKEILDIVHKAESEAHVLIVSVDNGWVELTEDEDTALALIHTELMSLIEKLEVAV